jgi:hypothetical protein
VSERTLGFLASFCVAMACMTASNTGEKLLSALFVAIFFMVVTAESKRVRKAAPGERASG